MNRNLHHPRLRLKAANPAHTLEEPGAHVWGGGPVAGPDGRYYHLYARWAAEAGFHAWVTHSKIGWAVGDSPLGPWTVQGTLLGARRGWDQVLHNPDVHCFEGRYYLYDTGNHGDGDWWTHRNHQRVGVAVADCPERPAVSEARFHPGLDRSSAQCPTNPPAGSGSFVFGFAREPVLGARRGRKLMAQVLPGRPRDMTVGEEMVGAFRFTADEHRQGGIHG